MELIERDSFISLLEGKFQHSLHGEGHTVFVSGESGIGKTSLIRAFSGGIKAKNSVFVGSCDALFTPRPLAPLYDVALQLCGDAWLHRKDVSKRVDLFTRFYQELKNRNERTVVIFEDIHWADEATFDFVKFLARRVTSLPCLFILTHRNDECKSIELLRNIVGQLAPHTYTRMVLPALSKGAVEKLAQERGYNGEDVYSISGGNPFYVNEILAYYSNGVPVNIKDSILCIYNQIDPHLKDLWDTLSILPTGLETKYLEQLDTSYLSAFENCFASGILVSKENRICFKHELYRRAIEETLSPLKQVVLHRKILELFRDQFEAANEIERIVHHAKNANANEIVVRYAPIAAREAASVGAHIEASNLYLTAIAYYQGNDTGLLVQLYESYAYECYLTNQTREAILYTCKAYEIWKDLGNVAQIGNTLQFLSRLWWFEGNRIQAEHFGKEAIKVLEEEPPSSIKAKTLSNMSQLKMLEGHVEECIYWGEQAITMAKALANETILSHALNNIGAVQMMERATREEGRRLLRQSLDIALKNDDQEHVARAYTNLGSGGTKCKEYASARTALEEGIRYCEERDLNSWTSYMSSWLARLRFETGDWDTAHDLAISLIANETHPPVVRITALIIAALIKMRRDEPDILPYLTEAKIKAFETREVQRVQPVLTALLEYEWLTGKEYIPSDELKEALALIQQYGNPLEKSEFAFWLLKARQQHVPGMEWHEGYRFETPAEVKIAAAFWRITGCPYEQAMILFEGTEADKKEALSRIQELGAKAVYHKLKQQMRSSGIKNIPRGVRNSTLSNPAHLTERELGILQLLHEGMQNKEIAGKLYISPKTVDHHISSILVKLDVNSRSKAAKEAVRMGIIK